MKKHLLFLFLCLCAVIANAQDKKGVMYLTSPANYQVLSISENGLWACGIYSEDGENGVGFRWNLQTGKIETFGAGTNAYTVSNNGTVAGSFTTAEITGSAIEVAATWNGSWNILELPATKACWATAISPDGHYVTGTDNNYVSYIWKDGKIQHTAKVQGIVPEANGTFLSYAIAPDGSKIGGWAYYSDDNRNPGYWDTADKKFHELNPGVPGSPWQSVKKFTPDGKRLLYWGGYSIDNAHPEKGYGIKAVYDIETQTSSLCYPLWDDPFNFDLYDIGGNGSVVGYIQNDEGLEYGYINVDGNPNYIEDYLVSKGADFNGLNIISAGERHLIIRAMALSADEKKFGLLYYDNNYDYHSLIVLLDQNMGNLPPVCLEGNQVSGIMVASLSWQTPLGDKSNLKGYNIYRNDVKINNELITDTKYYDQNLQKGTYSYSITAVYADGESEKSEPCVINITTVGTQSPRDLIARQKGYKGLYAEWNVPSTNYVECNYFGQNAGNLDGFGGGEYSFESGTLFPAEHISLYKNHKLIGVSFIPGAPQGSWIINIYRHVDGNLTLLKSVPVTQELNYGEVNTVKFPQPLAFQDGQDLLIGVQTNVTESSYNVQAVYEGCLKAGYTDLIRIVGDADFFSINSASQSGEYDMCWATTAILSPADVQSDLDNLDHYNIFIDGKKSAETKALTYEDNTLSQGSHEVSVQAIYADARESDKLSTNVALANNEEVLKITPTVSIDCATLSASWQAPTDNDPTVLGYCSDEKADRHPNATANVSELVARIDFTPKELNTYQNYTINSLSFFPLSNASYEIQMFENGNSLMALPVEDVILGQWNTIALEEPIEISKGKTYSYLIICYDCPANEPPLAMDNSGASRNDYSSLLQSAGEDGWYKISEETGFDGNWMMRANISAQNCSVLPVAGYDVYIDGIKMTSQQKTKEFTRNLNGDLLTHTFRVDAVYTALNKAIEGNTVTFRFTDPTSIADTKPSIENHKSYNLHGLRVDENFKGIIIRSGKAILNK